MNKKLSTLLVLLLITGFIGGCSNTFDGLGKDLSGAGGWLEETF